MSASEKLSTTATEALAKMRASPGGVIERWPGGFWTIPGTASRDSEGYRIPEWSVSNGAQVLRSLARRGLIVPSKEARSASGPFVVEYRLKEAT